MPLVVLAAQALANGDLVEVAAAPLSVAAGAFSVVGGAGLVNEHTMRIIEQLRGNLAMLLDEAT